jgi:hypothetical protein
MYMRNTLLQLNLLFPMYWYPTRDLYIVIHLSLLYLCAKSILSPISYIYSSKYIFIHTSISNDPIILCVQYIVNGPTLLACNSMRMSVK